MDDAFGREPFEDAGGAEALPGSQLDDRTRLRDAQPIQRRAQPHAFVVAGPGHRLLRSRVAVRAFLGEAFGHDIGRRRFAFGQD